MTCGAGVARPAPCSPAQPFECCVSRPAAPGSRPSAGACGRGGQGGAGCDARGGVHGNAAETYNRYCASASSSSVWSCVSSLCSSALYSILAYFPLTRDRRHNAWTLVAASFGVGWSLEGGKPDAPSAMAESDAGGARGEGMRPAIPLSRSTPWYGDGLLAQGGAAATGPREMWLRCCTKHSSKRPWAVMTEAKWVCCSATVSVNS